MDLDLKGKVALVTGAGGGFGAAIAAALAEEGCFVYLGDSNREAAARTESLLAGNGRAVELDVCNAGELAGKVQRILSEKGRVDVLVNSAGLLKTGSIIEATAEDWDQVCRVNLSGVFYCSKAVLPAMLERRSGKIINIASMSAVRGGGVFGNALYGATKAGVIALTKGFARDLGPFGINVNAIAPGLADTPMTRELLTAEKRRAALASIPLGRLATTADIAKLAVLLASDVSQYITGETIVIDGGYLTK